MSFVSQPLGFSRRRFLQMSGFTAAGFTVALSAHQQNFKAEAREVPSEKETLNRALTIGTQAYIWGYSLVVLKRTLHNLAVKRGVPLNQFLRSEHLATPESKAVVAPNNDTLYASAWLDLRQEPIILHVPDTQGRYYSVQFLDAFTDTFAYVGRRVTGTKEGNYAIVGPDWRGTLPKGVKSIKSPTYTVWCLARTLVYSEEDLPVARALQQQYTLTPVSAYGNPLSTQVPLSPSLPRIASGSLQFYDELGTALQDDLPPKDERPLLKLFAQVGIGPNRHPSQELQDQSTLDGLKQAVLEGERLIDQKVSSFGTKVNGWLVNYKLGNFGKDYLLRAATAKSGLGANTAEESVYFTAYVDEMEKPFIGTNRYLLRFNAGQFPPVDAFWSLTLYGLDRFLVANPINRYAIGDRTKGLQYNSDGSLEIYIQHEEPIGNQSNWLPTPIEGFYLMLRAYQPKAELLTGTYKVPSVKLL